MSEAKGENAAGAAQPGDAGLGARLLAAAGAGAAGRLRELLARGADAGCQGEGGVTPLMRAAEAGSEECVALLLGAGAPWHEQDAEGYTAGEYASGSGHRAVLQQLLDWAVCSELLLGSAGRRARRAAAAAGPQGDAAAYLGGGVRYDEAKLLDDAGEAVMMEWERPLMERHADIVCASGGDVLNVGFGLGIVDGAIQARKPRHHTIIEAHPAVYARMLADGWADRPGVRLVHGRWQDVIADLGPFDGVFFDTFSEDYEDMREFHDALPRLLRPGGAYSFFNGLCPDNLFFHLTAGEVARRELERLGFSVRYQAVPMAELGEDVWQGVKSKYWHLPVYFVPTCTWGGAGGQPRPEPEAGAGAPSGPATGQREGPAGPAAECG